MALKIQSTRDEDAFKFVNAIVYGQSGIGKTVLCSTAPKPLILSAEDGLLSLAGKDVDFIAIKSFKDLIDTYNELYKSSDHGYETVCIDSVSELAETILSERKREERDPRKAYGTMADEIVAAIRKFKKLELHTIFVAKLRMYTDEFTGKQSYAPGFPGKALNDTLPYQVDLVLPMRMGKHEGKEYRYLQTSPDIQYEAKDRSGILAPKEPPDLAALITKISDHAKNETETKEEKANGTTG